MNVEYLDCATNIVKQYVKSNKIPGAVSLIAQHGKILSYKAFGYSQINSIQKQIDINTPF